MKRLRKHQSIIANGCKKMNEPLTEERKEELRKTIAAMGKISHDFYYEAIKTNNHPFIEFCGLMNEYIVVCSQTLADGKDFSMINTHAGDGQSLTVREFNKDYLEQKLNCIFDNIFDIKVTMKP